MTVTIHTTEGWQSSIVNLNRSFKSENKTGCLEITRNIYSGYSLTDQYFWVKFSFARFIVPRAAMPS